MSQYAGNFRGDRPTSQCPLCGSHDDEQQLSFTCPVVMKSVKIDANYEEIYQPKVQKYVVEKLKEIDKLRADCLSPAGTPSVHQS